MLARDLDPDRLAGLGVGRLVADPIVAVVVTADGAAPVLSHAYAGDRPDVTQFPVIADPDQTHVLEALEARG